MKKAMNNSADQVVWITGASSGVGEKLAQVYAEQGARLILSARNLDKLQKIVSRLELCKDSYLILPFDLQQLDGNKATQLKDCILDKFGRLDLVFLNAGISQRYCVQESIDIDIDRQLMETNFFSVIQLVKVILPLMLKNNHGHIVVTSSVFGKFGYPLRSSYAASKHALHGYFDSLRAELVNTQINITLLILGAVKTAVSQNALTVNGLPYGKDNTFQTNAISAEKCAIKIKKLVVKKANRDIVIADFSARLALILKLLYPTVLSRLFYSIEKEQLNNNGVPSHD